jgi:outer membrane protein OmpA-like peptidoglycan-associated protein
MQEQSKSAYQTLAWLLLLVVIGLYALHLWYGGMLKQNLATEQAKATESALHLAEAKTNLDLAARAEQSLRDEINRLQASHRSEVQGLTAQIQAATEASLGLKKDMEALKQQDTQILAAEQHKAAEAYANLQARYDAANQNIETLGANIDALHQAQADAAERHEAQLTAAEQQHRTKLAEMEAQFNERVAALRTTLQGSDPERAALFASFEQRVQQGQEAIAALETAKNDLSNQITVANQTISDTSRTLAETQQALGETQAALTQTRGELASLEARYDAAMDKAAMDQATLQAKHDAAEEKAAQERTALEAQHAADLDRNAKQIAAMQAQHAAALDQAAKEQAALLAEHEAAMAEAAKVRADLQARYEAELAQTQATHADQMDEAQGRINTLSASLSAEQAALAALQTKHDHMVEELRGNLADTEKALAGARADLTAATEAAARQKADLEQQLAAAKERLAATEETLSTERKQHEAARLAAQQAHAEAMARQRDLLIKVSDLGGRETERGTLLSLAETDLQFPISKATLPAGDLPSLDRIAALLAQYPRLTARIEGHTDAAGREETNLALSQARADAVKQALVDRGVAQERLEAVGLGESRPIADNATKAGSRQNRRVEIYLNEVTR